MKRKKREPDLSDHFEQIPEFFVLGYRGKNGTVFGLKEVLDEKKDKEKIEQLKKFLLRLPHVRRRAQEMRRRREYLMICLARPESDGYPNVIGFCFRDRNEIADCF